MQLRVRRAVLLICALLIPLQPGAAPRDSFFAIDQPLAYGLAELETRLAARRAEGPLWALHLSGGSARGFAHLGVLRRLEELGLFPDLLVTNSMGSIVGLLYTAGVPLDIIEDIFRTVKLEELFTPKLPGSGGVLDMRRLLALTEALIGDRDIAGLPLPIVVVCEDLTSMRRVLLARGPFGRVLEAAIALPAVFDPVELEGRLLIDGGITNLVPLAPFAGLTGAAVSSTAFYDRDLSPDDPMTVLHMSINIAKSRSAVEEIKTYNPFLIRTDVEQFTYMGWHSLDEIIARGYRSASMRGEALVSYLSTHGIRPQHPAPALPGEPARLYAARWAEIKSRLAAGRPLKLPRGFGAWQIHPLLFRGYRLPNRLEERNYLAAGYLYEKGYGSLRLGALSDLGGKYGGLLHLDTAPAGSLILGLHSHLFFTARDREITSSYTYQRFSSSLPLLPGPRLVLEPFFDAELRLTLPGLAEAHALTAGLKARFDPGRDHDFIRGRAGWFSRSPGIRGLESELMLRRTLLGPLKLFSRALAVRSWAAGSSAGIRPSYNDFFRGIRPDRSLESFVIFNNDLLLAPGEASLDVWETVLVEGIELSAFCDLLWQDPTRPDSAATANPSLGLSLQAEAGLMGLVSMSLTASGGYDLEAEEIFLFLNLGAVY
jgi:predicted acylesterase/phospholipase RssA